MDQIKKRKIDDNGVVVAEFDAFTLEDAQKILEPFTYEALLEIVQKALLRHPDVLEAVRSVADRDPTQRKLFVRGLGWETSTEKLRAIFSSYGELDEAVVIMDKTSGKSKGYGFVTFKHVDGAIMALKEPSKKIDGRMTVTQLAAAGNSGTGVPGAVTGVGGVNSLVDVSPRKIYVANVPFDMLAERLLQHFSMYGEIEEGPLGYDKVSGKSKGFALFVYKTAEAARASLVDPVKNVDGHQLNCKLAIDGKRGKPPGVGAVGHVGVRGGNQGNGNGIDSSHVGGQYGGSGGIGGQYGGFSAGLGVGAVAPGAFTVGAPPSGSNSAVSGGYGSGVGGAYAGSQFVSPAGTGYGGLESAGGAVTPLGGGGSGIGAGARLGSFGNGYGAVGGGMGGTGRGSSFHGFPPSSAGMGGDYMPSGHYNSSSGGYQGQHIVPTGASSGARVPPGAAQGMHPYY